MSACDNYLPPHRFSNDKEGFNTGTQLKSTNFYYTNNIIHNRQWREEQAAMLAKKDNEERIALEELRNQAKTELKEWYSRHEEQLTQTKGLNR